MILLPSGSVTVDVVANAAELVARIRVSAVICIIFMIIPFYLAGKAGPWATVCEAGATWWVCVCQ
jgi:hypothetical protein